MISYIYMYDWVCRCGMVSRVLAFQPGSSGLIPSRIRNFHFYLGTWCVSFVKVLSCAVSCGGPDIVLITHSGRPALVYLSSVLVHSLLLPPTCIWHMGTWVLSPGEGGILQWGRVNNKQTERERERERERESKRKRKRQRETERESESERERVREREKERSIWLNTYNFFCL